MHAVPGWPAIAVSCRACRVRSAAVYRSTQSGPLAAAGWSRPQARAQERTETKAKKSLLGFACRFFWEYK